MKEKETEINNKNGSYTIRKSNGGERCKEMVRKCFQKKNGNQRIFFISDDFWKTERSEESNESQD